LSGKQHPVRFRDTHCPARENISLKEFVGKTNANYQMTEGKQAVPGEGPLLALRVRAFECFFGIDMVV
jgi:hypothetical protein